MKYSAIVIAVVMSAGLIAAQSVQPAFEVASVKQNLSGDTRSQLELPPGGRFVATNVPLKDLILLAYGLQDFQLVDAPAWIAAARFDIEAKADSELKAGIVPPQLRALLAERFQLALHRETKDMPVYALTMARDDRQLGPQLQIASVNGCADAAAARTDGNSAAPTGPSRCLFRMYGVQLVARSMGVGPLSSRLGSEVGRFVIDKTGLTGLYDYDMTWSPDALESAGDATRPSIFTALRDQLGLKLESQRAPVEVTVVDRVEHLIPN